MRINGGFFIFKKKIFEYMRDKEELVIEPFHRLVREKQLIGYSYDGFWASMDTFKDRQHLEALYSGGAAPWEVWKTNDATITAAACSRRSVMLPLNLPEDPSTPLQILCLGAHSDDIEIGCGGTMLHLLSLYSQAEVVWVVFSSGREREREARASAALFLKHAKQPNVIVKNFRDGFFPYEGADIKEFL